MTMHQNDRTAIERECARLISQYAYLNDERDFEALASLFTEGAVLYRPASPDLGIRGREAILAAFKKRPADIVTFHVCSDVLIDVEDDSTAFGRSRILLSSGTKQAQGGAIPGDTKPPVPGTFRDRFQLTNEGWRFSERRGSFWIQT